MADHRYQDRPFPADDHSRDASRPRSEADPLAELARLIGQSDPFANTGYGSQTRRAEPVAPEAQDEAEPDFYHSPFSTDAYNEYLYSGYEETNAQSIAARDAGDVANGLSDKLTLYTVLMSISLFLLGIAAVVRGLRTQLILGSVAVVIFGVSAVLTALIPAVSL